MGLNCTLCFRQRHRDVVSVGDPVVREVRPTVAACLVTGARDAGPHAGKYERIQILQSQVSDSICHGFQYFQGSHAYLTNSYICFSICKVSQMEKQI